MRMSDQLAELISEQVSEEEVVDFCRELVRAPSENPPGNEEQVAKVAKDLLARLGLGAEFVEPLPGRVSTISGWGPDSGRTLLFNGHYDVVPVPDPDDWPHPPFAAHVVDGKLYGRGSTDMKAGVAACLAAVSALQRGGLEPKGRLLMHFVADEEALGNHGTKFLVANNYCDGVTEALVGEPTAMHLVTSERGTVWLRIITEGVSAHGSTPQLGVNAIEHMTHVIRAVSAMRFRKLHEMLGSPTINVGTIRGGSKVNMVAAHCEIEIDRRTIPGETTDDVVAEFEAVLAEVRNDVPELRARIEVDDGAEPSETPSETSLVGLLSEARDVFGIEGSEVGYSGATDARFLINQGRIPSVVFGPGDVLLAHTTGEHVEVAQLVDAARAYAHVFARFLDAT
jgi:acetylornithine deacetylase/succinyl-diaminopimelate desuccinylase family protein